MQLSGEYHHCSVNKSLDQILDKYNSITTINGDIYDFNRVFKNAKGGVLFQVTDDLKNSNVENKWNFNLSAGGGVFYGGTVVIPYKI